MVVTCAVRGCKNRFVKGGATFHRFPVDPSLRQRWISATSRCGWEPKKHDRICGDHFLEGKPSRDPNNPNSVPQAIVLTRTLRKSLPEKKIRARFYRQQEASKEKTKHAQHCQDDLIFTVDMNEDVVSASEDNMSSEEWRLTNEDQCHPLESVYFSESDDSAISSDEFGKQNVSEEESSQNSQKQVPSKIGYFEMDDQIIGATSMSQLQNLSRSQLWLLAAVLSKEIVRLQAIIHTSSKPLDMAEQGEFKVVYEGSPFQLQAIHTKTGVAVLKSHIITRDRTNNSEDNFEKDSFTAKRSTSSLAPCNTTHPTTFSSVTTNPSLPTDNGVIHAFACGHVCRICNSKLKLTSLHDRFGSVLPRVAIIPALTEEPKSDDPSDCPLEMTAETIDKDITNSEICMETGSENYVIISSRKRKQQKLPKKSSQFFKKVSDMKVRKKNMEVIVPLQPPQVTTNAKTISLDQQNSHKSPRKQRLPVSDVLKTRRDSTSEEESVETSDSVFLSEPKDLLDKRLPSTKPGSVKVFRISRVPENNNLMEGVNSGCNANTVSNSHLSVKEVLLSLLKASSSDMSGSSESKTPSLSVLKSVPNSMYKCPCRVSPSSIPLSVQTQPSPANFKGSSPNACHTFTNSTKRIVSVCPSSSSDQTSGFVTVTRTSSGMRDLSFNLSSTENPLNRQEFLSPLSSIDESETPIIKTDPQLRSMNGPPKFNTGSTELKRMLMSKTSLESKYPSSMSPSSSHSVKAIPRKTVNIVVGSLNANGKAEYFLERGYTH